MQCWYFPVKEQVGALVDAGISLFRTAEPAGDVISTFWQSPAAMLGLAELEVACPGARHVILNAWTDGGEAFPGLTKGPSFYPVVLRHEHCRRPAQQTSDARGPV